MTTTIDLDAATTGAGLRDDPLTDALRSLHVSGSLLLCEDYAPPWAIEVPPAAELAKLLGVSADRQVVAFHLVRRGRFDLQMGRAARRVIETGELVLCASGQRHRLSQGTPRAALSLTEALSRARPPSARATSLAPTALACGVFFLRDVALNPLFQALPSALHVAAAGPKADDVTRGVTDLLLAELTRPRRGSRYVVERLLELLCAQAVSAYADQVGRTSTSWFRGLRDPAIGPAMAAVHASPGEPWSVPTLARRASLSPSRFAARFRELTGESPMTYVTRWRMHVARQRLRDGTATISSVADAMGYESVAAFSRVFKRLCGTPPSAVRDAGRGASPRGGG